METCRKARGVSLSPDERVLAEALPLRPTHMATVSLKNVKKIYDNKVTAVHDFNLEIADKEFIVLVGPSGCGKSTTLRMIAGLEDISEGDLLIGGKRMNDVEPKDRDIAMVFQSYALYPHMTVYENMAFGLRVRRTAPGEIDARVREAARILEISHLLDRRPAALSGGQKQRVAIAGVMAMKPECIILDEPTAMLDPNGRREVIRTIHELNRAEGITVLLITHYMEEAIEADRIIVMDDGRIVMDGQPREIFSRVKELKSHGLDVPQVTELAWELKEAGMPLTDGILSREELVEQLVPLLR